MEAQSSRIAQLLSYMGVCTASLLIALRACAIWNRKTWLVLLTCISFLAQLAIQIRSALTQLCTTACISTHDMKGLSQIKGVRDSQSGACTLANGTTSVLPILTSVLVIDLSLLSLILFALVRLPTTRAVGIGKMLWRQGLVWLVAAAVVELPTVVCI